MKRLERFMCDALRRHRTTGQHPIIPLAGVPLWQIFAALSPGRGWHNNGPQPLSVREIREQGALAGFPLELRHVEVIQALDRAWLELEAGGGAARPMAELTPEIFDAMF